MRHGRDASSDQVERGAMAARAVYHGARVHVGTVCSSPSLDRREAREGPPMPSATRSEIREALQLPGYTIGAFVR
ncbi:hypothetical protein KC320_g132 [Hortaea werneckii]|nr:hypothetical protein KC320_g132 [Hortaea werneckii]